LSSSSLSSAHKVLQEQLLMGPRGDVKGRRNLPEQDPLACVLNPFSICSSCLSSNQRAMRQIPYRLPHHPLPCVTRSCVCSMGLTSDHRHAGDLAATFRKARESSRWLNWQRKILVRQGRSRGFRAVALPCTEASCFLKSPRR
jgi:hypothetical protein